MVLALSVEEGRGVWVWVLVLFGWSVLGERGSDRSIDWSNVLMIRMRLEDGIRKEQDSQEDEKDGEGKGQNEGRKHCDYGIIL